MAKHEAVGERLVSVCRRMIPAGILSGTYLGGGTGLALQIHHRVSLDLDFFLGRDTALNAERRIRSVEATFGAGAVSVDSRSGDQLDLVVDGIRTSFIIYPFDLAEALIPGDRVAPELSGLFLASPQEIALMKAYAMGRRAVFRDYIDMYVLLKDGHVSLDYIHKKAPPKFLLKHESVFSMRLFLQQLVYTADTGSLEEKASAVSMLRGTGLTPEAIEAYLASAAKSFTLSVLAPEGIRGLGL